MVPFQGTDACDVVMVQLDGLNHNSWFSYDDLINSIQPFFPETEIQPKPDNGKQPREIAELEARWLPRRGHELEGYPPTNLIDEQNVRNVLRMIIFRRGTDVIEATLAPE
jgi:hypothetical protein